jgi:hypothetical protein
MDDFPKLLRAWADYLSEEAKIWPAAEKMVEAANRIEQLEAAINDWCDAIVDWEGIDFVERIENEGSRKLIETVLEKKDA